MKTISKNDDFTVSAGIPFSGFYDSYHSDYIDNEIEQEIDYFQEEGVTANGYYNALKNEGYNYSAICKSYATEYAEAFIDQINSNYGFNLEIKSTDLESPKFYNFTTDRIFIDLDFSDILKVREYISENLEPELMRKIKDMFTSCDGFISHYSNSLLEWGYLDSWDYNQFLTLFEVLFDDMEIEEYEIIENAIGNGMLSNAIDDGITSYVEINNED